MPTGELPLVSVIIPFFNVGYWLAEAVESVISQTYTHWEAILIDDGSEAASGNIAREYSDRYPGKIIYTDHPGHVNKGVTISRNRGISVSKGSYIAFLDADDCWLPGKLAHQLALFSQHPKAAMIAEASIFWYSWNDHGRQDVVKKIGVEPDCLYHAGELTRSLYPLGKGAPPCPTGIIISRAAFERSGGFEESFSGVYQLYEDQAFLCKVYLREEVYVSGMPNNRYRKRAGSLTGSADDEVHYKMVRLFFLDWFQQYILQHHGADETVIKLIISARNHLNS